MNAIKRSGGKKKIPADRSRYSEDRDCCRLGGALDSFDYGRFDRRGEAVQIRRDSWHAAGPAGSRGPAPEPPRSDCSPAMMPRVAPSFHAENTQTYSSKVARLPATGCLGRVANQLYDMYRNGSTVNPEFFSQGILAPRSIPLLFLV